MINRQGIYAGKKSSPVDRNERTTAIAGAILFVFILVELFITASLHGLTTEHIFVGILLSGPLVVKMFSTGYRFIRYYTRSTEFVRIGPPNIVLRLLAPFLVLTTFLVFISGYGLAFGHDDSLFGNIHATSVAIWIPLVSVHAYAYIRKVPAIIASDWSRQTNHPVPGRNRRLGINIAGLLAGVIAAIVLLPLYAEGWGHLKIHLPGPLVLGILIAIIAVLVTIPVLRLTNKAKQ
ncbi:hypothetical protein [Peribacillus kribbensis]|uniref:hypothetical protein n=1 Tax=Peribacillus kribbensis TaxID=356658 RepID=UPI000419F36A|nr:hypothetical protein [Peribacillus kribbensis]